MFENFLKINFLTNAQNIFGQDLHAAPKQAFGNETPAEDSFQNNLEVFLKKVCHAKNSFEKMCLKFNINAK